MSTKVSGSPIAVKTLCERQAPMSRRGRHALRPATQLLGLRLAATVVERSQNRIRGSDRANAYFGRDEFVLHSPASRDESECVGQDHTTFMVECIRRILSTVWTLKTITVRGESLMARDQLLLRIPALFAVRGMVPQVQNPDSRATWFPNERIVASPPVGQFKSEKVRDVCPIVADEIARPAILCHRVASSQRVRPATKLERREALELGSRKTLLVLGSQLH